MEIIYAIVVSIVVFVIFTIIGLLLKIWIVTKRLTKPQPIQNRAPTPTTIVSEENVSFDPSVQVSMRDIVTATDSFSSDKIIGCASFGLVYKAELNSGRILAIKRLSTDAYHNYNEFRSELEIIGNLRHRNIVKLLGYCISGGDKFLIYDYLENGSLDSCLHAQVSSLLSWETRVNVVRGVANGLAYMHELEKPVIHRNVSPEVVLLGSDFEARIGDFGIARKMHDFSDTHVSTDTGGALGYEAPEYCGNRVATKKGDVYSFGVLMLEVATGKRPIEVVLNKWTREMASQNREWEMLDPRCVRVVSVLDSSKVKEYFRIALMCTSSSPMDRPTMREVVDLLKE